MRFRIGTVGMVTAAMVSVLTCYTLSLRVSAERSKVDDLRGQIATEMKDVRALEAELKTRSRLPQLQRWNDNVLALTAPTAKQYVDGPVQLASFAPGAPKAEVVPAIVRAPAAPAAPSLVHTAAYTVPAPVLVRAADTAEPATSFDKLRTNGGGKETVTLPQTSVRGEPVEPRVAPKPVKTAKADPKPTLDSLLGDIDRAATAERSNLVKVSLR